MVPIACRKSSKESHRCGFLKVSRITQMPGRTPRKAKRTQAHLGGAQIDWPTNVYFEILQNNPDHLMRHTDGSFVRWWVNMDEKHCIPLCSYVKKPLKSIGRTLKTINSPWLTSELQNLQGNYSSKNVHKTLWHHLIFPRLCKTNLIMIYFEPTQISATQHVTYQAISEIL